MVIFSSLTLIFYRTYVGILFSFFSPPNDTSLHCNRDIWTWLHNYSYCSLWWLLTLCCLSFVQVLFLANCTKSQVGVLILLVFHGTQFTGNASNSCRVFFCRAGREGCWRFVHSCVESSSHTASSSATASSPTTAHVFAQPRYVPLVLLWAAAWPGELCTFKMLMWK